MHTFIQTCFAYTQWAAPTCISTVASTLDLGSSATYRHTKIFHTHMICIHKMSKSRAMPTCMSTVANTSGVGSSDSISRRSRAHTCTSDTPSASDSDSLIWSGPCDSDSDSLLSLIWARGGELCARLQDTRSSYEPNASQNCLTRLMVFISSPVYPECVCVYIYIYIYIYIYLYKYVGVYIYVCMYVCIRRTSRIHCRTV